MQNIQCEKKKEEKNWDVGYRLKQGCTIHKVHFIHVAIYTFATTTRHKDRGPAVACR
jgi:hypothetical protein